MNRQIDGRIKIDSEMDSKIGRQIYVMYRWYRQVAGQDIYTYRQLDRQIDKDRQLDRQREREGERERERGGGGGQSERASTSYFIDYLYEHFQIVLDFGCITVIDRQLMCSLYKIHKVLLGLSDQRPVNLAQTFSPRQR